jgi:hypothetical protein
MVDDRTKQELEQEALVQICRITKNIVGKGKAMTTGVFAKLKRQGRRVAAHAMTLPVTDTDALTTSTRQNERQFYNTQHSLGY